MLSLKEGSSFQPLRKGISLISKLRGALGERLGSDWGAIYQAISGGL